MNTFKRQAITKGDLMKALEAVPRDVFGRKPKMKRTRKIKIAQRMAANVARKQLAEAAEARPTQIIEQAAAEMQATLDNQALALVQAQAKSVKSAADYADSTDPIAALFDGIRFHVAIHRGILISRVRNYVNMEIGRFRENATSEHSRLRHKHRTQVRFLVEALELEQQRHRQDTADFSEREPAEMGEALNAKRF